MFETLKRLYDAEKLDKAGLKKAVAEKNWITVGQYEDITGDSFN